MAETKMNNQKWIVVVTMQIFNIVCVTFACAAFAQYTHTHTRTYTHTHIHATNTHTLRPDEPIHSKSSSLHSLYSSSDDEFSRRLLLRFELRVAFLLLALGGAGARMGFVFGAVGNGSMAWLWLLIIFCV